MQSDRIFIFTFSYSSMVEKVLFWGQILEKEILTNLQRVQLEYNE